MNRLVSVPADKAWNILLVQGKVSASQATEAWMSCGGVSLHRQQIEGDFHEGDRKTEAKGYYPVPPASFPFHL
jgi:hypothetical protein